MKKNTKVMLGNICYPKSEALIIPANTKGVMTKGRPLKIIKDGLSSISKEAKHIVTNNKIEMGGCFVTGPGRLKRRGLKKIYHAVIRRLQSDFTSIYIVREALNTAFQTALKDEIKTITVCGVGIEVGELDKKSVAVIITEICDKFDLAMEIKIIDDNEEFIKEVNNLIND